MNSKPRALAMRFVGSYIPILIMLLLTLFPFYWMAITSLKSDGELYDLVNNPLVVLRPVLTQYQKLLNDTLFPKWITNTLIVSSAATALSLTFSALAGYSLARMRFRGATSIGWAIFITYLVPPTLLFIPLLGVVSAFGLQNSLWSLIFVYPTFLIPFGTWMLIGYFKSIPRELEESALVDGATRLQAMWRIVMPLALPGLLSVGIFAFTLSWNEFIYALVFLSDVNIKTIPVGVTSELIRGDSFFWGELMAGALLGSIPVAVIYSFFVEYFVAGLTAGAVKG
jgi:multiple sugar transport system permease protein